MANAYITIKNSEELRLGQPGHKFRVPEGQAKKLPKKNKNIEETIGGKLSVTNGSVFQAHQYVCRVKYEWDPVQNAYEIANNFGTYADLKAYFLLNNPQGAPTDVLQLTDHYNEIAYGYMTDMNPQPLTVFIDGYFAWYDIQIVFRERDAIA